MTMSIEMKNSNAHCNARQNSKGDIKILSAWIYRKIAQYLINRAERKDAKKLAKDNKAALKELLKLDDTNLKDIGISRAEIQRSLTLSNSSKTSAEIQCFMEHKKVSK